MEKFLNLKLIGNPLNWVTIALWLLIIGYAVTLLKPASTSAGVDVSNL